jgi:viroplasmin and RNaseH domain-containing protein
MGANWDTYSPGVCSKEELKKKFALHQSQECYENGNDGYAGHIGIVPGLQVYDKEFDSYEDAEEWLEESCEKWECAKAVKYAVQAEKMSKSAQDTVSRYEKLDREYVEFDRTALQEIKSAKSLTIGCKNCGSSISRKHLYNVNCPICNTKEAFLSNSRKERKKRLKERRSDAFEKAKKAKKTKPVQGTKYAWLVGAWCPS